METETLEQVLARHRKELKDLQGRITNKKKNASKKTRKGINDECADMERQLRDKQTVELAFFHGDTTHEAHQEEEEEEEEDDDDDKGADVDANALHETRGALPPSAGGEEGRKKKKKNRQKERLARRAAEQEVAMQRAHDEAANMTDHRARESEYMKRMFETHGLVEKDINPDGHCLFSAVADQLDQLRIPLDATAAAPDDPPRDLAYKVVRRTAVEYMVAHPDDFAPFLEEDLAAYASRMRDTAEWGGQLELTALARRYGVEIRVIQDGRTEKIGDEQQQQQGRTLWLAYYRHGYGLGEHYNSLRKMTTTTTTTTTQATTAAATAG